jgi:thioredoxin 1
MTEQLTEGIHFIKFGANWCGPCKALEPALNKFEEANITRVKVHRLDVDTDFEEASKYGIRNIPTLLFFKNGELVDKQVGAAPKSVLAEKINAHL